MCVVINDKKTPTCVAGNPVSWTAEVMEANDYYPFGQVMPGRMYALTGAKKTRFGYNGKEKDAEVGGDDYDFGARMYDARVARWMSMDPLSNKYPNLSVYSSFGLNPILFIDPDGEKIVLSGTPEEKKALLECMQKLTNDKLDFDPKTGVVIILTLNTENCDKTLNTGTDLIRELNHKGKDDGVVTVKIGLPGDGNSESGNKEKQTVTLDVTDPGCTLTENEDGVINSETRPNEIGLGHELIHAFRDQKGLSIPRGKQTMYKYFDADGTQRTEVARTDEYETVGLKGDQKFTDNKIRSEQNVNKRVCYSRSNECE